jgi:hypothetical protein
MSNTLRLEGKDLDVIAKLIDVHSKGELKEEREAAESLKKIGKGGSATDDRHNLWWAQERLNTAAQIYVFKEKDADVKRCVDSAKDLGKIMSRFDEKMKNRKKTFSASS